MPIYEYRCDDCRRVFSFLVRSVKDHEPPECPQCGKQDLDRVLSPCSMHSGGSKRSGDSGQSGGDLDDLGMGDEALDNIPGIDDLDENAPRSLGRWMRRMADEMGEPLDPEMDEICRRLESGEDPEKIDEELGESLGGEMGSYDHDDTLYDA